ncbi:MAG: L,D-transpeptidase [Candidatus Levybacteria bacterium]|nr:L,D-transpeptidase [Candidatus Levybacteria bacterium]
MKKKLLVLSVLIISLFFPLLFATYSNPSVKGRKIQVAPKKSHWFVLHRKAGREFLYYGILGEANNSKLVRTFQVKPGIAGQSPTPLPKLLDRDYWLITKKESSADNPETAPYFLTLNIPVTKDWPFGPAAYPECNGSCDWVLPGEFGLHGVNGNVSKLSKENRGSSGCVRHSDEDITFLFNLLNPEKEEIRYYIEDI